MVKVALIRCEDYEYENIKNAVQKGIDLLGGIEQFASRDEKIVLKPNLLSADLPTKCSTTNHVVFKAVGELFKKTNAKVFYGDSPAFHSPLAAAKKSGIHDAAKELDISLTDFENGTEITYEKGTQNKKFTIANGVLDSDGLISISKLKAHGLTRVTGAVKNQFGCVPGTLKGEFHVRIPDAVNFAKMLIDLNKLLRPRLYIMDGVIAMEGNGPRSGTPRQMNVLLFSTDPIALDATMCRIINLEPEFVPTIKYGKEYKLGTYIEDEIEIVGEPIGSFYTPDFDVKREPVVAYKARGLVQFLRNTLIPKPYIKKSLCVKCGICVKMCPVNPKALNWKNDNKNIPPEYIYKKCIRCYCCQELCPEGAIKLKVPLVRKLYIRK